MEILHDADVDYILTQDTGRNFSPAIGLLGTNPEDILTRLKRAIKEETGQEVESIEVDDVLGFYTLNVILEDGDREYFRLKRIYNY